MDNIIIVKKAEPLNSYFAHIFSEWKWIIVKPLEKEWMVKGSCDSMDFFSRPRLQDQNQLIKATRKE